MLQVSFAASNCKPVEVFVAAVSHRCFNALGAEDLARKLVKGGCVIDVKSAFDPSALNTAGLRVWRL